VVSTEQTAAAGALHSAGTKAIAAAGAFGRAVDELNEAVTAAHSAGIPPEYVPSTVAGGRALPAEVSEHLRKMIRRIYRP
jgi:hypothetical protein